MPDKSASLSVDNFIKNAQVQECVKKLNAAFPPGAGNFIISDVLDEENHQYVNLVQKGGGVLGVALVGYTYILELMGIRFIRLAGTSAGAINTALLTVFGKKEEAKSLKVLDVICKLNFFNLVDGHPAARWLIKNFITNSNFTTNVKKTIIFTVALFLFLIAGDFVFLAWQDSNPSVSVVTKIFFIATAIVVLLLSLLTAYIVSLLKRLKNAGFGINPGNYFYNWLEKQLTDNGIKTVTDLQTTASTPPSGMHLRVPNEEGLNDLNGDVTFIASELVTENKIQFPGMCNLFRKKQDIDTLHPAGFVRASMSIPVFFESYFINDIPCNDPEIREEWSKLGENDPPSTARFVDGGILSNFPINLFYNPKVITPRLPSLGIDLDDSKPDDSGKHSEDWSLGGYFYRIFNTIRFYYDKDFLIKNAFFKKGIGTIPLENFNWLNFFLTDDDKIKMFVLGAQTATDFLINFNWDDYKNDRNEMRKQLLTSQVPTALKSQKV